MATSQELAGLEIGNYAVKVAQLGGKPKKVCLKVLDREVLPPTENQSDKDQAIIDTIQRLYNRNTINGKQVAITISSAVTTIKRIQIPKVATHLLRDAVLWEAEQYLPFNLADFQLDFQILPEGETPYHQLLLVAAPKKAIEHTTRLVRRTGLYPVVMDVPALALENQYALNYSRENSYQVCLLDIGARNTIINILRDGYTAFSHTIPLGGNDYTQAIQDTLGIDYAKAEDIKQQANTMSTDTKKALDRVSNKLAQELQKHFDPSNIILNDMEIEKIFLSGGGCLVNGLATYLQTNLNKPVFFLDPLSNIKVKTANFTPATIGSYLASMPIAVGLGLRSWPSANFKRL